MREGVLKFFNVKKGFGFINDNETGKRYFVRFCSFSQKLARIPVVNSKVFFDVAEETEPLKKRDHRSLFFLFLFSIILTVNRY